MDATENKLGVINASSLAMGLLTAGGPAKWHPATDELKDICAAAAKFCKDKNVDIAKLGLDYALSQEGADVHLVSAAEHKLLDLNLDVAINGLNELEKSVQNEILTKFFNPLTVRHWEGIEIAKYWNKLDLLNRN
uniref:NADP-dependent oxidoreductase domain-containing protein n=1 Tax=Strigamia maritima TaxID=126957 RepID=T1IMR6_STRMM